VTYNAPDPGYMANAKDTSTTTTSTVGIPFRSKTAKRVRMKPQRVVVLFQRGSAGWEVGDGEHISSSSISSCPFECQMMSAQTKTISTNVSAQSTMSSMNIWGSVASPDSPASQYPVVATLSGARRVKLRLEGG
jgi:hypothetical protein